MRILIVSHFPIETASYYRHIGIAKILVKMGHQVTFLLRSRWKWSRPYPEPEVVEKLSYSGMRILQWHEPFEYLFPLNSFQVFNLARKADVIHLIRAYPFSALPTYVAKMLSRKPLIDEMDDWDGIGGWASMFPCSMFEKLVMTFFEEFIPRRSEAVVAVSKTLYRRVTAMQIPERRVFLIPNSVDVNLFNPSVDKKTLKEMLGLSSEPLIVYVGILYHHEVVNLKILVEMMKHVVKEIPEARLMVIGRGPGLDSLRRWAQRNKSEKNIILVHDKFGFIPRNEMPKFLGAADVAINLLNSQYLYYHACSPQSLFEYMAMRLPIVASNVGEAREALKKGGGILVSGEEPEDYADAVVKVLKNPKLSNKLANEARRRAVQFYSDEVLAARFETAYRTAMEDYG